MTWHLNQPPYEVQRVANEKAHLKPGFAYFLEQGLGKTAVILNEITDLVIRDEISCGVGYMPKSLLYNWRDEAEKMGFKPHIHVWRENPKNDNIRHLKSLGRPFVVVINFEAVITDAGDAFLEEFYEEFGGQCYTFVDESSKIKNPQAKRTKKILRHCLRSKFVRMATGTPVTQSVADLWSQLRAIDAVRMRFFPFRNKFCVMGGYLGKQIIGPKNLPELQKIMDGKVMIAKKKDWTDLPEKLYVTRKVELTKEQVKHYREIEDDLVTRIDGKKISAPMTITALGKMQQIVSGFAYDKSGKPVHLFKNPEQIPKVQTVLDFMEDVTGKVIVFCVLSPSIDILLHLFEKKGMNPAFIRGGMKDDERKEQRDKFNKDASCRVIVCQSQSGGIGLTLLGGEEDDACSTTVYYENDFSLETRLQTEDRNHRHGQHYPVTYLDVVSTGVNEPVEMRAIKALQNKESVANAVQDPLISRQK